jgi:PEP-CTERM motif
MKKRMTFFLVALLAIPFLVQTSSAGVVLGYPDFTAEGNVSFDSSTGLLTSIQTPIALSNDGVNFIPLVSGNLSFSGLLSSFSSNGTTVSGYFTENPSVNPDFSLTASDGTNNYSIYGELRFLNIVGVIGSTIGTAESIIDITSISSNLAPYFEKSAGMLSLYFNVSPTFSSTTFQNSFSGSAKTDVATVPEPGTIIFLGIGMVGLACWGRKRTRRESL